MQPAVQLPFDPEQYPDSKKNGTAKLIKLNGTLHYSKRAFDSSTGAPMPVLVPFKEEQIDAAIQRLEQILSAMKQLKGDIASAPEVIPQGNAGSSS